MHGFVRFLTAILLTAAIGCGANAQNTDSATDPATIQKCDAASQRLAELQADETVPWSAQTESGALLQIWSSPECTAYRRQHSFDIEKELQQTMDFLKKEGIAFEADLDGEVDACMQSAQQRWDGETAAFRKNNSVDELTKTCALNAWQTLYAEGLVLLYKREQADAAAIEAENARKLAEYEEELRLHNEREAEKQRAYEAEVAAIEERNRIARENYEKCIAGEKKFCKKKD